MNDQVNFYKNKLAYEIDSWDLFQAIENRDKIQIIDARKPQGFENEHIPGAINLPHASMTVETTKNFDRSITYVCYCDGIGCNASTKGALNLSQLGFKVKELMGGIDWWKRDGYATEGIQAINGKLINCAC